MKKHFSLPAVCVCLSFLSLGLPSVSGTSLAAKAKRTPGEDQQHIDFDLLTDSANGETSKVLTDLRHGAHMEVRDGTYCLSPLMWASWYGRAATVKALLAHGAAANATAQPPADFSFQLYQSSQVESGDGAGQNSQFDQTLAGWNHFNPQPGQAVGHFAQIKSNDSGLTALHLAVAGHSLPTVTELIKAGANVNAQNTCYNTPLEFGAAVASSPIVDTLLKHGALADPPGPFLQPVLFWAVIGNNPHVVNALLKAGADPTQAVAGVLRPSLLAQMLPESHLAPTLLKAEAKWRATHHSSASAPALTVTAAPATPQGGVTILDDSGDHSLPDDGS